VFRSAAHIYAQAIADDSGRTLAEASTLSKELGDSLAGLKKSEAAKAVGMLLAKRLQERVSKMSSSTAGDFSIMEGLRRWPTARGKRD
jgi:ribosomal protein L18